MSRIDYREILKKYIEHVGWLEGITFISDSYRHSSSAFDIVFTDEEWGVLEDLGSEA